MQTSQPSVSDPATRAAELRARSRTTATDLLKTVVSLSTGAIAVIFAMLTDQDTVIQPGDQALAILLAVVFFVAAVFAGLCGWLANSQRYYQESLAVAQESLPKKERNSAYERWSRLLKAVQLACFFAFPIFFWLGVVFAGWYILLRTPI